MVGASDEKAGWRKGPWTPEEDKLLSDYVGLHGDGRWSCVARCAGLNRSGKSCRLRWVNYLRPGLKRGQITPQEEGIIIELHALWGNKWSTIARYLPGRTDNEIKNYWRTHFKKKPPKTCCEKPDRRKMRRKRNNEEQENNGTTPEIIMSNNNIINQQETNNNDYSCIAAPEYMENNNNQMGTTKTTTLFEDIESWVDSFSMDGLWGGGGLWNLDDNFHDHTTVNFRNGEFIF